MDCVTPDTIVTLRQYLDQNDAKNLCRICKRNNSTCSLVDYISDDKLYAVDNGENFLHRAVRHGIGPTDAEKIVQRTRQFCTQSVDLNGNTALHRAIMSFARNDTLVYLISVNPSCVNTLNSEGFSPLHLIFRVYSFHMSYIRQMEQHEEFKSDLFREIVSEDADFLQATKKIFANYVIPKQDNHESHTSPEFCMYSTLEYILQHFPQSFSRFDKNRQVVLHYAARVLEFDRIHAMIPAICPVSCNITDDYNHTPLQMIVREIYENNWTGLEISSFKIPDKFIYGLQAPEYLILMVKLMIQSYPAVLDNSFIDNTIPIIEACENSVYLVYWLVQQHPRLLFQWNIDSDLAFQNVLIHFDSYRQMARLNVIKSKHRIIAKCKNHLSQIIHRMNSSAYLFKSP